MKKIFSISPNQLDEDCVATIETRFNCPMLVVPATHPHFPRCLLHQEDLTTCRPPNFAYGTFGICVCAPFVRMCTILLTHTHIHIHYIHIYTIRPHVHANNSGTKFARFHMFHFRQIIDSLDANIPGCKIHDVSPVETVGFHRGCISAVRLPEIMSGMFLMFINHKCWL